LFVNCVVVVGVVEEIGGLVNVWTPPHVFVAALRAVMLLFNVSRLQNCVFVVALVEQVGRSPKAVFPWNVCTPIWFQVELSRTLSDKLPKVNPFELATVQQASGRVDVCCWMLCAIMEPPVNPTPDENTHGLNIVSVVAELPRAIPLEFGVE
jgi:hypothetical protein